MNITELSDDDLAELAREWRRRSLRGEREARGTAHELEREMRRRSAIQRSNEDEHERTGGK